MIIGSINPNLLHSLSEAVIVPTLMRTLPNLLKNTLTQKKKQKNCTCTCIHTHISIHPFRKLIEHGSQPERKVKFYRIEASIQQAQKSKYSAGSKDVLQTTNHQNNHRQITILSH